MTGLMYEHIKYNIEVGAMLTKHLCIRNLNWVLQRLTLYKRFIGPMHVIWKNLLWSIEKI